MAKRNLFVGMLMLLTIVTGLGTGCTDTDVVWIEKEFLFERQQVQARVCAPEPLAEDVPNKILFVIDTSLSNAWNDPADLRELAIRRSITSLIDHDTVSFGVITFADEPRLQTFGFTRNMQILDGAIENVGTAQGGTNYSDTLWAVINFITDDLATLSELEAARTHYLIYWLSDGFPTVGVTDPTAILPATSYLLNLTEDRVAHIEFNTAFLGAAEEAEEEMVLEAKTLLEEMAETGKGEFTSFVAGEEFDFSIELETMINHFEFTYAVVHNRNALLRASAPEPDSDADGIADRVELSLGLDPRVSDSDGDGYRDGIELLSHGRLDPLKADDTCSTGDLDSDRDGLYDCEELILGSLPHNADSDGDRILDYLEVWMGTSPLQNDTSLDDDLDNISNQDEIRFHLDPKIPNSEEQAQLWAYRYQVQQIPSDCVDCLDPPPCYSLQIENLAMVETLASGDRPRGSNTFEIIVAFRGSASDCYARAQVEGRVLMEDDIWQPANGKFELGQLEFDSDSFCVPRH